MVESCIMTDEENLIINLYNQIDATIKVANTLTKVNISDSFVKNGRVKINVDFSDGEARNIKLRIPSWSEKTKVQINGFSTLM